MKKIIVGALVGGLLIFIWQFLSWTVLDLHRPAMEHTTKQDTLLSVLSSNLTEGGYLLPNLPKGASMEEHEKLGTAMSGKPWAMIQYHASFQNMSDMYMNMTRSLLSSMVMIALLCWILARWEKKNFGSILLASLFTGLIVFINAPYSQHIWYHSFDIRAHLIDAIAAWGLTGIWLGWWMKRA
ncbi:hypothetical protein [Sediminibacterium soli]|uniref:hypothetical protein n=1 Tax=Sediminibacterium soli TaxID=2698829 RepID=UPI00137A0BD4|nr:hypothetical protein [Sediminibacterium soli]NCI47144.1 hypothetical protein [Sediminibacterium soli]